MNAPVSMYYCKQIINHDQSITLPDSVYKMKNMLTLQTVEGAFARGKNLDISQQEKMGSKINFLQSHQETILKQLEDLRKQMLNIKMILKTPLQNVNINQKSLDTDNYLHKIGKLHEFVINVNPSHPPYSILILKKMWATYIKINIEFYIHSNISTLSESANKYMESFKHVEPVISNTNGYILIRIIWKDVNETSIFVSPTAILIQGEVNFLRYICRVGPKEFNYELHNNPNDVDYLLDICYLLARARTKTERHSLLQLLNSKLGKGQWFCNNNITIADIAIISIIKQVVYNNEMNNNLSKWINHFEKL